MGKTKGVGDTHCQLPPSFVRKLARSTAPLFPKKFTQSNDVDFEQHNNKLSAGQEPCRVGAGLADVPQAPTAVVGDMGASARWHATVATTARAAIWTPRPSS